MVASWWNYKRDQCGERYKRYFWTSCKNNLRLFEMNKNSAVCKCSNPVVLQCKPNPKEVYDWWCDSCMNGTSEPKRWVEVHKSIKSIINSNNRLHRKYTLPNRPKVHRVMCKDCDECLAMFYESSSFASSPLIQAAPMPHHATFFTMQTAMERSEAQALAFHHFQTTTFETHGCVK